MMTPKTLDVMPKGCQHGANIDAKTHQTNAQTGQEQIHENHKHHVSLNGKIIKTHGKMFLKV